ncbi:DEAD/DEAH box helicase [Liquorilactobacillus oeni]|uniref:DEAD-box ATP-dependent RNA helicase CshA n=1 Tax=Liquorilactobacillus oeni DSM 19972 TaxID=1423777 RepID=A0A0R1ME21_9LACO|nr:DEAD/DEAH box helicase [Liquorilactobacillus oeni]KRL06230.1 ATP-dependent RNA helicase [Liquorilactobacillus oeni DSM 19972]
MKFTELGLSDNLLKAIKRSGFEEATPIQAETIPLVLKGNDVIGQAQTGTGKTAAFGLPILNHIDVKRNEVQAVIISPTRELAIQTQEELFRLGRDEHAKVQVVYGGADIRRQIKMLKRAPQIVVGTPGRLLDHIRRRTIDLSSVETLVLDEADEMLDMGFVEDIESIIKTIPDKRQTLLFSATMPSAILKIGEKFMTKPEIVKIKSKELTTDLVDQYYVRAKDFEKFDVMTRILDVQAPELTILFGRTKRRVDELSKGLEARGYNAKGIHGDLSQQRRMSILKQFKAGKLDILVATDVAARGLDISGVTHVYNYDIPQDPESYVHRIGRTGRAGHHGVSVTFVTPNEVDYLRVIEKLTKKRMTALKPPTQEEAFIGQVSSAVEKIGDLVRKTDTEKFSKQVDELLKKYDATDLIAALINEVAKDDASKVPVKITPERPLPSRRKKGSSNHYSHNKRRSWHDNGKGSKNYKPRKEQNRDKYSRDRKKKRKFTIRVKKD